MPPLLLLSMCGPTIDIRFRCLHRWAKNSQQLGWGQFLTEYQKETLG